MKYGIITCAGLQPGRPAAAGGEGHRGWNLVWKHRRDHRDQRQVVDDVDVADLVDDAAADVANVVDDATPLARSSRSATGGNFCLHVT